MGSRNFFPSIADPLLFKLLANLTKINQEGCFRRDKPDNLIPQSQQRALVHFSTRWTRHRSRATVVSIERRTGDGEPAIYRELQVTPILVTLKRHKKIIWELDRQGKQARWPDGVFAPCQDCDGPARLSLKSKCLLSSPHASVTPSSFKLEQHARSSTQSL